MEGFFGIPHIANQIFETLTTQDLGNCREVSPEWFNFVEEEKILWKRIRNIHPYINGRNLLHIAAITGQATRFETAFNFSIMMGKKHAQFVDNDGDTPLHNAAENGSFSICDLIVNHSDDKNLENNFGLTPLVLAAQNGHMNIVEMFIKGGINDEGCNPKNVFGNTPLHEAAKLGHLLVCQIIVEKVKDVNPANNVGTTPLHLAAMNGHASICELIIRNAENKNPTDGNGTTPLHTAAMFGNVDVTEVLLRKVEFKFPTNGFGMTPLEVAKENFFTCSHIEYLALERLYESTE